MKETLDLIRVIENTRRGVRDGCPERELDGLLAKLTEKTRQFMREHEGMAEELLNVYEQLGAVFEISRKLPHVQDECEVVELLRARIEETYSQHVVGTAWSGEDGTVTYRLNGVKFGHESPGGADLRGVTRIAWLDDQVVETQQKQGVVVRDVQDECDRGIVQLITAPVLCNGRSLCVLLVGRPPEAPEFRASDMGLIEVLTTFCGDLIANIRLHHQLRQISVDLVRSLVCAIDQKDPYTSGHSLRVGYYARRLGQELCLKSEDLQMLEWSALLHDVGKIGIRDEVLKKPGKLTNEEFAHIKEHPVRSFDVVSRVPQLRAALDGIRHHHERYDGRGYPDGLKGEDIPLQARIIQVADIFDALTSSRSYRGAFDWQKALSIIEEEAGTVSDPNLARIFTAMIRRDFQDNPEAWEAMTRYGQDDQFPGNASTNMRECGTDNKDAVVGNEPQTSSPCGDSRAADAAGHAMSARSEDRGAPQTDPHNSPAKREAPKYES